MATTQSARRRRVHHDGYVRPDRRRNRLRDIRRDSRQKTPIAVVATSDEGFPLFPRLPLELRLKIWDIITDAPRAVVIQTTTFQSPTPAPVALHVCLESREVALKKYELIHSSNRDHTALSRPAPFWFNFEKDMLYFRNRLVGGWRAFLHFPLLIAPKYLARIQFLCTDIEPADPTLDRFSTRWPSPLQMPPLYKSWLKEWTGLKILYRSQESRLDMSKPLTFHTLQGNRARNFVRQYRWVYGGNGRFRRLSVSTSLEKIRSEATIFSALDGSSVPVVDLVTIAYL